MVTVAVTTHVQVPLAGAATHVPLADVGDTAHANGDTTHSDGHNIAINSKAKVWMISPSIKIANSQFLPSGFMISKLQNTLKMNTWLLKQNSTHTQSSNQIPKLYKIGL